MLGLIGLGSLIKAGVFVAAIGGAFAYGQYTCKVANDRNNLRLVIATERRLNAESSKLFVVKNEIERQVSDAIQASETDTDNADVCISSNGLWRINNIKADN